VRPHLVFDAWTALMAQACPRAKGMPCSRQVSASQYQVWTHSHPTSRSGRNGWIARRKGSGLAGRLRDSRRVPAWSRTQTNSVLACRSTPTYDAAVAGRKRMGKTPGARETGTFKRNQGPHRARPAHQSFERVDRWRARAGPVSWLFGPGGRTDGRSGPPGTDGRRGTGAVRLPPAVRRRGHAHHQGSGRGAGAVEPALPAPEAVGGNLPPRLQDVARSGSGSAARPRGVKAGRTRRCTRRWTLPRRDQGGCGSKLPEPLRQGEGAVQPAGGVSRRKTRSWREE